MSFDSLFKFESALSRYTGAPYVVLTDSCTHAIEMAMKYLGVSSTEFPARTYLSVLQTMRYLGIEFQMTDDAWIGEYQFQGTPIWDSARRLEPGMYRPGQIQCLSFGHSKPLQLGRVGAILLDDAEAHRALSCWRSDGRDLLISPWEQQHQFGPGYHYCPTLEDCARGLDILPTVKPQCQQVVYPDLRKIELI